MATSYPGGLDDFAEITTQRQDQAAGGRTHKQMHNDLGDAVEAIQTELGTNPAGSESTVAARIAAVEGGKVDTVTTGFTLEAPNDGLYDLAVTNGGRLSVKPRSLPDGLIFHLDAQDSDTITLTGGKVSKWTDKIGGREFIQATDANRPVLGTMNGRQALEFDGTNDVLTGPSMTIDKPATVIVVAKHDATRAGQASFAFSMSNLSILKHTNDNWQGRGPSWASSSIPATTPAVNTVTIDGAASTFAVNSWTSAPTTFNDSFTGTVALSHASNLWDGVICEVLIFSTAVTPGDLAAFKTNYLNPRWNMS